MENQTASVAAPVERTTKLLSIGRAWDNSENLRSEKAPRIRIRIDRNLGLNITLTPMSELVLFANRKREGRQDADFRVAVNLPAGVVDQEVARQRATRGVASAAIA